MPISREERLPLSFAQERLWFLHQLEPESVAYSMPGTIRLWGALDIEALSRAFDALGGATRRFAPASGCDGVPEQVIAPEPSVSPEVIDLRQLPENEREDEVVRLTEQKPGGRLILKKARFSSIALSHGRKGSCAACQHAPYDFRLLVIWGSAGSLSPFTTA